MAKPANADPFAAVRAAGTSAGNYDLDTDAVIARLERWRGLCSFRVVGAGGDTVDIEFDTLPADLDAFVRDLYEFCPDLVDQVTGCVAELVEAAGEAGTELPANVRTLIEGVDFGDEDYGLEILKRELERGKSVTLWWD